jgi:hypothetical protein
VHRYRVKNIRPSGTEMLCQNELPRGTISESEANGPERHTQPTVTSFIRIKLKGKQLTGKDAHLCKEGVTRILPRKSP